MQSGVQSGGQRQRQEVETTWYRLLDAWYGRVVWWHGHGRTSYVRRTSDGRRRTLDARYGGMDMDGTHAIKKLVKHQEITWFGRVVHRYMYV